MALESVEQDIMRCGGISKSPPLSQALVKMFADRAVVTIDVAPITRALTDLRTEVEMGHYNLVAREYRGPLED